MKVKSLTPGTDRGERDLERQLPEVKIVNPGWLGTRDEEPVENPDDSEVKGRSCPPTRNWNGRTEKPRLQDGELY